MKFKKPGADGTKKAPTLGARVTVMKDKGGSDFTSGLLLGPGQAKAQEFPNGVKANALEYEDDFSGMYGLAGMVEGSNCILMEPPFNPLTLDKLTTINNALQPCIDAMITNIDGTGFEILDPSIIPDDMAIADPNSGDAGDQSTQQAPTDPGSNNAVTQKSKDAPPDSSQEKEDLEYLKDFFNEPWPGISFSNIRRQIRRDKETFGYAFAEVVRNPAGKILFLRWVDARTVRLVKLDLGQYVNRTVKRGGKMVTTKVKMRFRRFCQRIGLQYIFFKEFGADLQMDKRTGKWNTTSVPLKPNERGSELLYFPLRMDVNTPYGLPRWINQLPSILGSRAAEENNLQFFESGGIPPFIMLVSGGVLAPEAKEAIELGLSDRSAKKQRGMVVEIHSTSGSLSDSGDVHVQIDKMGSDREKDSRFENYDDRCERRVRGAFRLPGIFVGKGDTLNFATAFASYMVGEAQIFAPERKEFDDIITLKLIPELLQRKNTKAIFRSLPIVINDSKERLLALMAVSAKGGCTYGEFYKTLNEITGLKMQIPPSFVNQMIPVASGGVPTGGIDNVSNLLDASTAGATDAQG